MVMYALERRHSWFILAFACGLRAVKRLRLSSGNVALRRCGGHLGRHRYSALSPPGRTLVQCLANPLTFVSRFRLLSHRTSTPPHRGRRPSIYLPAWRRDHVDIHAQPGPHRSTDSAAAGPPRTHPRRDDKGGRHPGELLECALLLSAQAADQSAASSRTWVNRMLFPDGSRKPESIPYGRASGCSVNSTPRPLSSS